MAFCHEGFDLELSDDGTTWDGRITTVRHVAPGPRARPVLTYNTTDGPVTCAGPPPPTEIEIDDLYMEGDSDAYAKLRAAHYADTPIWARWNAKDATKRWIAKDARVLTFDEPDLDADSNTLVFYLATLTTTDLDWEAITP